MKCGPIGSLDPPVGEAAPDHSGAHPHIQNHKFAKSRNGFFPESCQTLLTTPRRTTGTHPPEWFSGHSKTPAFPVESRHRKSEATTRGVARRTGDDDPNHPHVDRHHPSWSPLSRPRPPGEYSSRETEQDCGPNTPEPAPLLNLRGGGLGVARVPLPRRRHRAGPPLRHASSSRHGTSRSP